jgi:transaldolase
MGASFRSKEQVLALAGCDYLTIGTNWLQALADSDAKIERKLQPSDKSDQEKVCDALMLCYVIFFFFGFNVLPA